MSRRNWVIVFSLVIIAVFASASLDWLRSASRTAIKPAAPLAFVTSRSRGFFASLREVGQLRAQVTELTVRNAELEAAVTTLQERLGRDQRFATQRAAISLFPPDRLRPARVIARSPLGLLEELILDQGTDDGVVAGQPVLSSGFLVGVINQVSASTSTARLLISPETVLPVVLGESRGQGLLRGGLDGLLVTDLPIDVAIKPGERVVTSSLGSVLPSDIPVGQVGSLVSRDSEILGRVTLSSPIKFSDLAEVVIVIDPGEGQ